MDVRDFEPIHDIVLVISDGRPRVIGESGPVDAEEQPLDGNLRTSGAGAGQKTLPRDEIPCLRGLTSTSELLIDIRRAKAPRTIPTKIWPISRNNRDQR